MVGGGFRALEGRIRPAPLGMVLWEVAVVGGCIVGDEYVAVNGTMRPVDEDVVDWVDVVGASVRLRAALAEELVDLVTPTGLKLVSEEGLEEGFVASSLEG